MLRIWVPSAGAPVPVTSTLAILMTQTLYRQRPDFAFFAAVALAIPIAVLEAAPFSFSGRAAGWLSLVFALVALALYSLAISTWVVKYDPEQGVVIREDRTAFLMRRALCVRVADVQSVASFIVLSKSAMNWVVLVPRNGNAVFHVARFNSRMGPGGSQGESRAAARTCAVFSSALGVANFGYAGVQVITLNGTCYPRTPQDRWLQNQPPQPADSRHG